MPRAHELWDKEQMTGSLCSKRSPKCSGGHSHSSGLSREQCFNSQSVGLTRAVVSLSL